MNNLKKLLVMSASIVAIGLLGGLSVFADCEDEDRYICEEQTDFNLDDEERYLEEEDQDLDDEERYLKEDEQDLDDEERYLEEDEQDLDDEEDPFTEAIGGVFRAIVTSNTFNQLAGTTAEDVMTMGDIAEFVVDVTHAVADAARRGMEYNANHPTDPSNPWNVD